MSHSDPLTNKKAACATHVEQAKLLVTLASAFIVAPPGLVALLKDRSAAGLETFSVPLFVTVEALLITSVLLGYVVLGSIAGSQNDGSYDVYRSATRVASLLQFIAYVMALVMFVALIRNALG